MSDPKPIAVSAGAPLRSALILSAPAFFFAVADSLIAPRANLLFWCALGGMAVLCLVTNISLPRSPARRAGFLSALASSIFSFCLWLAPGVWLFLAASIASYVAMQLWPQAQTGAPWFLIVFAAVLAFAAAFAPLPRARFLVGGACALGIISVLADAGFLLAVFPHRTRPDAQTANVWVLDSNGTPTPYLQDTMPDPAAPSAAGSSEIPKVDSAGRPIWVYDAVDGNGRTMLDAAGNPVKVPTDSQGGIISLPPGAATAAAERIKIISDAAATSPSFPYHAPVDGGYRLPLDQSYLAAVGGIAIFALAAVQFMAFRRAPSQLSIPRFAAFVLLLAFLLQGFSLWRVQQLGQTIDARLGAFSGDSGAVAPVGSVMQLVGSWFFGSASAGWWFMMVHYAGLLLVLIAATRIALTSPSVAPPAKPTRLRVALRASVAVVICLAGAFTDNSATFFDPLFILFLLIPLMLIFYCLVTCFAALWTPMRLVSAVGILTSLVAIVFYLAGPLILSGTTAATSLLALFLAALWVFAFFSFLLVYGWASEPS